MFVNVYVDNVPDIDCINKLPALVPFFLPNLYPELSFKLYFERK